MATAVGKYAAKKLLSSELKKYQKKEPTGPYVSQSDLTTNDYFHDRQLESTNTPQDPYYTYIQDPRRPNKKKKVKKQIPDYLSENDALVLAKARKRAYWLDCSLFNFLGQRFGWSSVIGLIPFIGDGGDAAMAFLFVYRACTQVDGGLPLDIHIRMLINIALDFLVGLVPFLGDFVDAMFKANSRNVRVLERYLDKKYKPKEQTEREARTRKEKRASGMRYESPPPATILEDMDDDSVVDWDSQWDGQTVGTTAGAGVSHPPPAAARQETRGGPAPDRQPTQPKKKGGWFSSARGSQRQPDPEMGQTSR